MAIRKTYSDVLLTAQHAAETEGDEALRWAWHLVEKLAEGAEEQWPYYRMKQETERAGLSLSRDSERLVAAAAQSFLPKVDERLRAEERFDYSLPDWRTGVPSFEPAKHQGRPRLSGTTFATLLERWETENQPKKRTVRSVSARVDDFTSLVGSDDASNIGIEEVVAWRDALLKKGQSRKTINDKLAAIGTLMKTGKAAGLLIANPFEGQSLKIKETTGAGDREYTDREAASLLKAAREAEGFSRWWPWVCAYTGMRITEVGQLRGADVSQDKAGVWVISVSREAGGAKTEAGLRAIPVHSALVAEGFAEFATQRPGRLFPDLVEDKDGSLNDAASRIARRWLKRAVPDLPRGRAPSHGLRHRFETLGIEYGLSQRVLDAIIGHKSGHVRDRYGHIPMKTKAAELEKIPALNLDT